MSDTDTDTNTEAEKPVELPDTVELVGTKGTFKTRLVVPNSLGLRYEVAAAVEKSEPKAVCAALGLCSSTLRQKVRFDHDVFGFGGRVLEWLLVEQGVPYLEILRAGRIAWARLYQGLSFRLEVKETEGFTGPRPDGSTG